jgi:hypothetical protein
MKGGAPGALNAVGGTGGIGGIGGTGIADEKSNVNDEGAPGIGGIALLFVL